MVQKEPILVEPVIDPATGSFREEKEHMPLAPAALDELQEPPNAVIKDSYPEYVPVPVLGRNSPSDDLISLDSGSSVATTMLGSDSSLETQEKHPNIFQRIHAKYKASKLAVHVAWTKENLQYLYALLIMFGIPMGVCYAIPQTGLIWVFWISSGSLFLTTLWLVIEALGSIPHWYFINKLHREAGTDDLAKNIGAVISAYLPNEVDTIEDCIRAVMSVDLPEGTQLRILISHNGGKPEQVKYLRSIISSMEPPLGVTIQDHHVLSSTSKAENVNSAIDYFAETSPPEIVVMYDADHQPAKHSVIHALQTIKYRNADLVQGRCVVSRGSTNIAAEFDTIYAVNHAGGAFVRGFGIFGGSNGFWKFELLQRIKMDESMLTEDVDSGFRALASGARIEFDPTVTSHEESPSDLKGLMKQRVRWSQGWSQVGTRQLRLLFNPRMSLYRRFMVFLMLHWRELFYYLTPWILGAAVYSYARDHRFAWYLFPVTGFQAAQGPVLALLAAWHVRHETHPDLNWKSYLKYLLVSPFYEMFKNMICLMAHYRNVLGLTKWNVTARKKVAGAPEKKFDLADEEVAVPTLAYDQNEDAGSQDGDDEVDVEEAPSSEPPAAPPPSYAFASGLNQQSVDTVPMQNAADVDLEKGDFRPGTDDHTLTESEPQPSEAKHTQSVNELGLLPTSGRQRELTFSTSDMTIVPVQEPMI
ncbi:hypothetical protein MNAN1_001396 [Malassezia nana]|uniref:Glycosyltransferase 2-like domain-containing protein n=1 Tax=Malassezia nana TaxID=180528 RepID=A0AAF0EPB9_9BASI|nr:hypothetical protein MNAN1_001396 [Malassezia nana]